MAEWSNLDDDLLVEIVKRIKLYEDFVNFGCVCFSWRAAAVEKNFGYALAQVPWLLLPRKTCDGYNLRSFFRVSTGKIRQVILPEANGKRCLSSKGWLLTISQDLSMSLLHPFSRNKIRLPHLKSFENWVDEATRYTMILFISKFALSATPSSTSNYILMVIYGGLRKLGYYKTGNKSWTTIEEWQGAYYDVTYYKGLFYALDCKDRIVACDFRGGGVAKTTVVASMPEHVYQCRPWYIVESGGSLLVVSRKRKRESVKSQSKQTYHTYRFQVFQVELDTNIWTEVKDLGSRALFLGNNSSFSLEASDSFGTKPNSIYFTDDDSLYYWKNREGGGKDMGIYNIKDEKIDLQFWGGLCNRINPPMWI